MGYYIWRIDNRQALKYKFFFHARAFLKTNYSGKKYGFHYFVVIAFIIVLIIQLLDSISFVNTNNFNLINNVYASNGTPTSPTPICGQPILNSPYSYNGVSGTFTAANEPAGLPTFGTADTDFPNATSIIVVPAGDNTTAAANNATYQVNNAIVYFEPGTHQIKAGMYAGHDSVYIGGYDSTDGKAIITGVDGATNGTGLGGFAFTGGQPKTPGTNNTYDTWEYLTVENFTSNQQSAIMGDAQGGGWDVGDTYMYDTIGPNEYGYAGDNNPPTLATTTNPGVGGGYAIDAGSNTTIEYNCLVQNAQGGFNGGGYNINISHNEIAQNGLGEYPDDAGPGGSPNACGCSGGGKLFNSINPTVDYNYVHDNYNAGIWLDFDNTGADISYNYIANDWSEGIFYEGSYNANISNNTLVGNGWASNGSWPQGVGGGDCYGNISCTLGEGPSTGAGGGNPYSAIYLPNTGGNSNLNAIAIPDDIAVNGCSSNCTVTSRYVGEVLIQNNVLTNNFGGVSVYTDTNRFPVNIDDDSACSVPLGSGAKGEQANSTVYYRQTKSLQTGSDAIISGSTVTTVSGTQTICDDYTATQANQTDASQQNTVQAPSIGMAVFNENSGDFLGNITSVSNANTFSLDRAPGDESGATLLISAYGGCGPADYYGGGPGIASGTPSANYWDNCLWGSRNVTVSDNTFTTDASTVANCTTGNMCGFMKNEAFNAGVPQLMRYWQTYPNFIAKASGGLNNVWSNNTYYWDSGSGTPTGWQFSAGSQGNQITQAQWQALPYSQDSGSTFGVIPTPTPTPLLAPTATEIPTSQNTSGNTSTGSSTGSPNPNMHPNWKEVVNAGPHLLGLAQYIQGTGDAAGTAIFIPKDSVSLDLFMMIDRVADNTLLNQLVSNPFPWMEGLNTASEIYYFNAISAFNGYPVTQSLQPVSIVLPYYPERLYNHDPHTLRIAEYDPTTNKWEILKNNTVLDTTNHTVANTTKDFTYFAVVYPTTYTYPTVKVLAASANNVIKSDGKQIQTKVTQAVQKLIPNSSSKKTTQQCFFFICW